MLLFTGYSATYYYRVLTEKLVCFFDTLEDAANVVFNFAADAYWRVTFTHVIKT